MLAVGLSLSCSGNLEAVEGGGPQAAAGGSSGAGAGATGDGAVSTAGVPSSNVPMGAAGSPEGVLASATCQTPQPGTAPLRRLSNAEYRNSVEDLFENPALAAQVTGSFVSENESLGFRNNANFLAVSSLVAQGYMDSAEAIAADAVLQADFAGCAAAADARSCAEDFISSFGKRVYRRALTTEETERYLAQYDEALLLGDANTGIQWVVFTMLQSPHFLYRVELGQAAAQSGVFQPTGAELASRLSYLLWQSTPDDALLGLGESGGLATREQVAAQARLMLQDPRSDRVYEFFDQWLDIDRAQSMQRDSEVFPDLDPNLPALFREETRHFVLGLLRSPTGSLHELLTANYTFMNADLAAHYGVSGPTGDAFEQVERADAVGFFGQGGFIASHDKPTRSSIVLRGLKMRTDLLCQLVPAPPNDVQIDLEAFSPDLSQRERLALHRADPACAGCHELMDPMGLVFETYDAVGRSRTLDEQGNTIDSSSDIIRTRDIDGPVSGPAELAARMANSEEVRACYTTQAFRFFYGRNVDAMLDSCSVAQLSQAFAGSQYNLSELLVALTQTDAFLYRPLLTVMQ